MRTGRTHRRLAVSLMTGFALCLCTGPLLGQRTYWEPGRFQRWWDMRINPLEFREPVRLQPFDAKVGMAIYGGPDLFTGFPLGLFAENDQAFVLDSTESEIVTLSSLGGRLMPVYDVDFVKISLRHRFFPVSVVDVLVGLGIRTNQVLAAPGPPGYWPENSSGYEINPVFNQAMVNLSIGYQHWEKWYLYLQYSAGVAAGSVYRAEVVNKYLEGNGESRDFALGVKRFQALKTDPRYVFGLELRFQSLNVPRLTDPENISPIEGVQLRAVTLAFTFSTVFGGHPSAADRAKRALYRGDYIAAEKQFEAFIESSGQHTELKKAREMLEIARLYTPYQQVDLARLNLDNGGLEAALDYYDQAELRADSAVTDSISVGRMEIGYHMLEQVKGALKHGDLRRSERLLTIIGTLLPQDAVLVERYQAETLIRLGHGFRDLQNLDEALRMYDRAMQADPARSVEIQAYKVRIGQDLLRMATVAIDRSSLLLALESLQASRALTPGKHDEIDTLIDRLEDQLERFTQGEISRARNAEMDRVREAINKVPPTKPRIGMLISAVEGLLGQPDFRTENTDRIGINHQLWEFSSGDFPGKYYFENYLLKRVEPRAD